MNGNPHPGFPSSPQDFPIDAGTFPIRSGLTATPGWTPDVCATETLVIDHPPLASSNIMNTQITATRHASIRVQQRRIPPLIVEWLVRYGSRQPAGDGASILYFDKDSRRRLARDVGSPVLDALQTMLDAYLIQGTDDAVITVGWRTQRVQRERTAASTRRSRAAKPQRQ